MARSLQWYFAVTSIIFLSPGCTESPTAPSKPSVPVDSIIQEVDTTSTLPEDITNSLGMKLKLIPAGEFMMGSKLKPEALHRRFPISSVRFFIGQYPSHRVIITRPFYIGIHEVTVGQFREFVEATGYKTDAEKEGWAIDYTRIRDLSSENVEIWREENADLDMSYVPEEELDAIRFFACKRASWRRPGFTQGDDHPVVNVSWNDAVEYCKWLSEKEGRRYRLPTEAEWEYACRAGTQTFFSFGDDPEGLARVGNVGDGTLKEAFPNVRLAFIKSTDGYVYTSPVGCFKPNDNGLYGMHGNVSEYCKDRYSDRYYFNSPVYNPQGPGAVAGTSRVGRGGNWAFDPKYCRSANRLCLWTLYRTNTNGFRVVSPVD